MRLWTEPMTFAIWPCSSGDLLWAYGPGLSRDIAKSAEGLVNVTPFKP
jgi:hypothetical protein